MTKRSSTLVACLIAAALALLYVPVGESAARPNDFAFYWTAARLVLNAENPYSPGETVDLQNRLSFAGKGRLVMLNPPWVLPFIAPFGLLSFSTAKSLWLLIGLTLMFVSVHWLWDLYGTAEHRWIGWLVAGTFLPVAVVLAIGQIGPLILFGIAGYLRFEARRDDYVAGTFLFLAALKPHLVFLVWIALLLCALYQRRWKPIAAFLGTLAIASFLAVLLDHQVFYQYAGLLGAERVVLQETPTLGGLLRHISGFPPMQFLPIGIAILWFVFYWLRWRSSWVWQYRLPSLLLVSVAATSYAWFFDQVILLPGVLYATVLALRSPRHIRLVTVILYLTINCSVLFLLLNHKTTFSYSWTALAWLVLFGLLQRGAVLSRTF